MQLLAIPKQILVAVIGGKLYAPRQSERAFIPNILIAIEVDGAIVNLVVWIGVVCDFYEYASIIPA